VKTDYFTQDLAILMIEGNGREIIILREEIGLTVKPAESLDSSLIIYESCNDISLITGLLLADNDIVAVKNVCIDHRAASDFEHEALRTADNRLVDIE